MVDEMLGQLLASFDYDLTAFRTALHSPVGPAPKEKRKVTRRPGFVVPLPYAPRPQERSRILLNEIVAGGPSSLPALLAYLREARAGDGRRGRQTDCPPLPAPQDDLCSTHLLQGPSIIGSPGVAYSSPGSFLGWGPTTRSGGVTTGPINEQSMRPMTPSCRSPRWRTTRLWNGKSGLAADGLGPRFHCRGRLRRLTPFSPPTCSDASRSPRRRRSSTLTTRLPTPPFSIRRLRS